MLPFLDNLKFSLNVFNVGFFHKLGFCKEEKASFKKAEYKAEFKPGPQRENIVLLSVSRIFALENRQCNIGDFRR